MLKSCVFWGVPYHLEKCLCCADISFPGIFAFHSDRETENFSISCNSFFPVLDNVMMILFDIMYWFRLNMLFCFLKMKFMQKFGGKEGIKFSVYLRVYIPTRLSSETCQQHLSFMSTISPDGICLQTNHKTCLKTPPFKLNRQNSLNTDEVLRHKLSANTRAAWKCWRLPNCGKCPL